MDESENLFQKLYTRQLLLNSDVLCSILSRLSTEGRAWTILTPDLRLRVLEAEELYIDQDPRANIGN